MPGSGNLSQASVALGQTPIHELSNIEGSAQHCTEGGTATARGQFHCGTCTDPSSASFFSSRRHLNLSTSSTIHLTPSSTYKTPSTPRIFSQIISSCLATTPTSSCAVSNPASQSAVSATNATANVPCATPTSAQQLSSASATSARSATTRISALSVAARESRTRSTALSVRVLRRIETGVRRLSIWEARGPIYSTRRKAFEIIDRPPCGWLGSFVGPGRKTTRACRSYRCLLSSGGVDI